VCSAEQDELRAIASCDTGTTQGEPQGAQKRNWPGYMFGAGDPFSIWHHDISADISARPGAPGLRQVNGPGEERDGQAMTNERTQALMELELTPDCAHPSRKMLWALDMGREP
jgi:hypothetical protein